MSFFQACSFVFSGLLLVDCNDFHIHNNITSIILDYVAPTLPPPTPPPMFQISFSELPPPPITPPPPSFYNVEETIDYSNDEGYIYDNNGNITGHL